MELEMGIAAPEECTSSQHEPENEYVTDPQDERMN